MSLVSYPPSIPSLQVAGRNMTDLTNLISLCASFAGAANGNSTLRKTGASAGYQVPVGKTFVVVAIDYGVVQVAANSAFNFGYADADVGAEVNTAFTNPVYPGGNASFTRMPTSTSGFFQRVTPFNVPAGKYPFVTNQANAVTGSVTIFGYEV